MFTQFLVARILSAGANMGALCSLTERHGIGGLTLATAVNDPYIYGVRSARARRPAWVSEQRELWIFVRVRADKKNIRVSLDQKRSPGL